MLVAFSGSLNMTSSSLEELKISGCSFGFLGGNFDITSSSFKGLTLFKCQFGAQRHFTLNCPSLENLTVLDSEFRKCFLCKIDCDEPLEKLEVCGSNFLEACRFYITCPSINHAMISSSRFASICVLNISSFSLQDFTVSECKFSSPDNPFRFLAPAKDLQEVGRIRRRIIVKAANLEKLNISSSDAYSYEFPLQIDVPNLEVLWWTGDPIDFSYLNQDMFMSLTSARIAVYPSCQHKSEESNRQCKRSKSLIYCAAKLLQCLSEARFLAITTWPIEIFFMQNDSPIVFKNLQNLVLFSDGSFADQIPFIASFLRGMPNLMQLKIRFVNKTHELSHPNLINLLGLNSRSFNLTKVSQDLKYVKIEAVQAEAQ